MRTLMGLFALAALGGQAVGAPGRTAVNVEAAAAPVDAELTAVREKYVAAVNAGDATALASLYAPDALVVVADGVVLRGAVEIARYFREAFVARAESASVTLRPGAFSVENGVASETGGFTESRAGKAEPATTGVYVTIYTRNAAGQWRVAMEIRTRGRDKQMARW